jgi:hypothetical protein
MAGKSAKSSSVTLAVTAIFRTGASTSDVSKVASGLVVPSATSVAALVYVSSWT